MHTVIVGSGIAGWTVARELRKLQPDEQAHPITLICADTGDFYSKPMLSNALASQKTPSTLVMTAAAKIAEQAKVSLKPKTTVSGLNAAQKTVFTDQGEVHYDQLVLALGADPIRLPITGSGASDIKSVNDLTDYAAFRAALPEQAKVVVMGAGLIGCEFANDLSTAGCEVTVFDIAQWPLGRLLPQTAGDYVKLGLQAAGVRFEFGNSVTQVEQAVGGGYTVTDSKGTTHQADLVLSAIGLKARTALAQQAGLKVDRGIVVDQQGRTSDASIFALGDCAQYGTSGLLLPYIQPVMSAGRAIAANLNGADTAIRFPAMPVTVKTPACPTVIAPPAVGTTGQWDCQTVEDGLCALFRDDTGKLLGMALLGKATAQRQALTAELPALWE
jgi:rubredoxin-NAD+ reductase